MYSGISRLNLKANTFRFFCVFVLLFSFEFKAFCQLSASNNDGKVATMYSNITGSRDTIFVFNQVPEPRKGNLSLKLEGATLFKWYKFDYDSKDFENEPFFIDDNEIETSQSALSEGGYKVIATLSSGRDTSFVAWIYMNPGFNINLHKDNNGELMYNYKNCFYNDFRLNPVTNQSTFVYYNPNNLLQSAYTFQNRITYHIRRGNSTAETALVLNTQGSIQYLREYNPPYEDTQYHLRAEDLFGVERSDQVMYRSIIPYAEINPPGLPTPPSSFEVHKYEEKSAPVHIKFTCKPYNVSEYIWRFGTGDSVVYDLENIAPDTIHYTYYTPKTQGYQVTLRVRSLSGCEYTSEPTIIEVDEPMLDVANVFTPNNDGLNDYFKPYAVSLRGFEIWIYTRTGRRVYYYRGNDLREWQGWDGRIERTGHDAPTGLYFYTIRAWGWNEPPTKSPPTGPYNGFVYLFR